MTTHRHRPRFGPLILGIACTGTALTLAAIAHDSRLEATRSHQRAIARQNREVGATAPVSMGEPQADTETAAAKTTICVRGVDTFVTAIARSLSRPVTERGLAGERALVDVARAAVQAERFVEQAGPAPTLPKRMGSIAGAHGRTPIAPPTPACDGTAYAAFPSPHDTRASAGDEHR